jgi:hypothetical protein
MKDILWICGILAITVGIWYIYSYREGFQVNTPSIDVIKKNFWDIVSKKDTPSVALNIKKVRDPAPNDTMPVKFPTYLSIYAMAKYNNDTVFARKALFDDYNLLQEELSTNVYDQDNVNNWQTKTKEMSCKEIDTVFKNLASFIQNTKQSVSDISGTLHKGVNIHDENMMFQNKFVTNCSKTPMSAACIQLASQDIPIYPLLQKYNNVTNVLYDEEFDLSNNLDILHNAYQMLKCQDPNPTLSINMDTDMQYIDTPLLNEKLQETSPYYISPETLTFLTSSIISPIEIQNSTNILSDMYINIGKSIQNIKILTS